VEIVTFAEIQKVKSSFEFKNSISSTRNCNEFRFFEPRFTSLPQTDENQNRGFFWCQMNGFLSLDNRQDLHLQPNWDRRNNNDEIACLSGW